LTGLFSRDKIPSLSEDGKKEERAVNAKFCLIVRKRIRRENE